MSQFVRKTQGGKVITPPVLEVKDTVMGLQFRFKLPSGGKMSISECISKDGTLESGHFHKGLREVYVVHDGMIELFVKNKVGKVDRIVMTPDFVCSYCVEAGIEHTIIKHPDTLFAVNTIGNPIPNKNRGGNDWYFASQEFMFEVGFLIGEH